MKNLAKQMSIHENYKKCFKKLCNLFLPFQTSKKDDILKFEFMLLSFGFYLFFIFKYLSIRLKSINNMISEKLLRALLDLF